jgi:hypothetical protein
MAAKDDLPYFSAAALTNKKLKTLAPEACLIDLLHHDSFV